MSKKERLLKEIQKYEAIKNDIANYSESDRMIATERLKKKQQELIEIDNKPTITPVFIEL